VLQLAENHEIGYHGEVHVAFGQSPRLRPSGSRDVGEHAAHLGLAHCPRSRAFGRPPSPGTPPPSSCCAAWACRTTWWTRRPVRAGLPYFLSRARIEHRGRHRGFAAHPDG
jgi:hypothetical protein